MTAFVWNWSAFFLVLLALLALSLIIFGALTAYFGSSKSRLVGGGLLVVGLIVGIFVILGSFDVFKIHFITEILEPTLFYVIAAIVGVLIGLLIFLGAIMKT